MTLTKEKYDKKMQHIKEQNEVAAMKHQLNEERNKFKNKKKYKVSNRILVASITAIILFTVASLFIQVKTGMEVSSTLTTLWYSFWTVEIVSLAGIKVTKVINERKLYEFENENTNDDYMDNNDDIVG